ncbi:NAD(P)/FAD-dependent oxidoreductase [Hyphococcus luteus]|uniref:Twin-arginine translocation pathway signal n=1 Tax=Hyphococcus luteus TaxID=2058213 RepID=A0A2S7K683_9PROT|nr:NAD(P)/FAD-dependent oxidoreductase [Marinicaulis flavus]PQA87989.1 twin-arginine translocation pathway signal [Marinicaulis flavus]
MKRLSSITRRDFLGGVSLPIVAGLAPSALMGCGKAEAGFYPPGLTGMRGSHAGSFETAHALAWDGETWPRPQTQTDSDYDLIVVGGGISGLAAAYFWKKRAGQDARILILDNHDDFGGHAKRNEFEVDGEKLIGYGGSQSLDGPSQWSETAKSFIRDIGVDLDKFYDYFDRDFYARRKMGRGVYLDKAHYGDDILIDEPYGLWADAPEKARAKAAIASIPWPENQREKFAELALERKDYLEGKSVSEKIDLLRRISYERFLLDHAGAGEEIAVLLRRSITGLWGVGWDALSALEGARIGMPGTAGLGLDGAIPLPYLDDDPYIFHFPDGNAGVARLIMRALRPDVMPGHNMEDEVAARAHYDRLDAADADVRVSLKSTVVKAENAGDGADVTYVKDGEAFRVRGKNVVLACYMHMLPYICPEMDAAQREAAHALVKIPLVYTNVALRNWKAFEKAGYSRLYSPQGFFESISLDFPVSMGGVEFSPSPDKPIVAHLQYVPTEPGLTEREQHHAGRAKLYQLSFEDFETAIVEQMTGMLGPYGFDAARDIAGITVNRWPHGYAYEYNELYDPWTWSPEYGPHVTARQRMGRMAVANSDSSALAYVQGAVDAADRAVNELLAL